MLAAPLPSAGAPARRSRRYPAIIAPPLQSLIPETAMAQYVYTRTAWQDGPAQAAILKDISLSFFPGAKIGVLGLNGSGKSSLLRIMAGVDREI